MTRLPDDDAPLPRARALYAAQVEATDGATRTALRARRRAALATLEARPARRWWLPAGGLATAALALALFLPRLDETATPAPTPAAVDVAARSSELQAAESAALAEGAALELENDAEFYAWLAEAPVDDGAPGDAPMIGETLPPSADEQEGWTL